MSDKKKKTKVSLSSGLWVDLYELTMAQVYFNYKPQEKAVFELFIRSDKRSFYTAYGIQQALNFLKGIKFSKEDIEYLASLDMFSQDFLKYLKKYKFTGDVWAVDEPEIVFAGEPILQVRGSLAEAQIIESALLNIINLNTTLLTKSARIINSAKARKVFDFSLRRTQGKEASLIAAKTAFVAGAAGTSNVLAAQKYGMQVVGTMAHSYVTAFDSELESFRAFYRVYPQNTILLIDTYSVDKGLENAMRLAEEIKKDRNKLVGVRIDSGNLVELAKSVRRKLDAAGYVDVAILASGDLDEYKVKELIQKGAPIDAFGVGTNMGTSSDMPYSDVVYKMVEITDAWGKVKPVMKYSENKDTLPYRKQVFRKRRARKVLKEDVITIASEKSAGKPLLKRVVRQGEFLLKETDITEHRKKLKEKLKAIPSEITSISRKSKPPVVISNKLKKSRDKTIKMLEIKDKNKDKLFFDVDTQHDLVDKKGALYVEGAHLLKKKWRELTEKAVERGNLIISSQDIHKKNAPEFKNFPPHCVKGSKGVEKISQTLTEHYKVLNIDQLEEDELYRIKEKYPQIILEKNSLDAFSNPNTKKLLEVVNPKVVYVYGVATEFCVRSVCLGLINMFSEVYLIEDAAKEVYFKDKIKALTELREKGIKFCKTEDVLK